MTLVKFSELMADAERGNYAVGYFESWNLESLQAVADAAEATHSPVILGFSGISIPDPRRVAKDRLAPYAALGRQMCRDLAVPACLLFNESPYMSAVFEAIDLGFNLVMFSDEEMSAAEQVERARRVVARAHARGIAVEAEMASLPGLAGGLHEVPADLALTGVDEAVDFVASTGIDALAVNVGQVHVHGASEVHLDLARIRQLKAALSVPLVLHGATSVARPDLAEAARLGIRKINVGSAIKRAYFEALARACAATSPGYNPYQVVGSGRESDVLAAARLAMQVVVEDMMHVFGCAGRA